MSTPGPPTPPTRIESMLTNRQSGKQGRFHYTFSLPLRRTLRSSRSRKKVLGSIPKSNSIASASIINDQTKISPQPELVHTCSKYKKNDDNDNDSDKKNPLVRQNTSESLVDFGVENTLYAHRKIKTDAEDDGLQILDCTSVHEVDVQNEPNDEASDSESDKNCLACAAVLDDINNFSSYVEDCPQCIQERAYAEINAMDCPQCQEIVEEAEVLEAEKDLDNESTTTSCFPGFKSSTKKKTRNRRLSSSVS